MVLIASLGDQVRLWLILGGCALLWDSVHRLAERRRARRFGKREVMSEDQWFKSSASADHAFELLPPKMVMEILGALAQLLDVMPTQLRCTDRLADLELSEPYLFDDPWNAYDDALDEVVQRIAGKQFVPDWNWTTIGDVIKGTVPQMIDRRIKSDGQ